MSNEAAGNYAGIIIEYFPFKHCVLYVLSQSYSEIAALWAELNVVLRSCCTDGMNFDLVHERYILESHAALTSRGRCSADKNGMHR